MALLTVATMAMAGSKGHKIETQLETHTDRIPAGVRYEFSRTVRPGRLVKAQDGREGVIKKTFRITYKDGKPVDKELVKEERRQPQPTLMLMSRSGWQTSRGSFGRGKVLDMVATGYYAMVCGTGRTRLGYRADYGHVAVDPRVIPLGSLVYVESYGFAIASDTGSAIKGHRIDLCFPDYGTAARYGHKHLKVHVLSRS
ncbi:putative cell wall shaping enzyme [Fimbriimonas ginsengisoli Gsoil 348]|uniref:Putative cell wall shaping enzyme n=1 Tax=Fimbriimonas ginsengisoli Gsoil 348 TaxID=661478 RepID=A0A068NYD1_FIMGI|nr:putative cell wall shaping enzyme [Fimbriimonas ginsengisoli Gsoil 348]